MITTIKLSKGAKPAAKLLIALALLLATLIPLWIVQAADTKESKVEVSTEVTNIEAGKGRASTTYYQCTATYSLPNRQTVSRLHYHTSGGRVYIDNLVLVSHSESSPFSWQGHYVRPSTGSGNPYGAAASQSVEGYFREHRPFWFDLHHVQTTTFSVWPNGSCNANGTTWP